MSGRLLQPALRLVSRPWGGRTGALLVAWSDRLQVLAVSPMLRDCLSMLRAGRLERDRQRALALSRPVMRVDVLAAPERHTQPEQRHYAQAAQTVACHDCGKVVPESETHDMTIGADDVEICSECAEGWRDEMAQDGPRQQEEQQQAQVAERMTDSDTTVRPTRAEVNALGTSVDTAHDAYLAARAQEEACFASWEREGYVELLAAREVAFNAWMDAQRVWLDACCAYHGLLFPDGPHAQPEQQQAQLAREIETGYPEAGYQTLAEGLRRLAAGRKALPAPLVAGAAPALALPTDRAENDALFEAADARARDLLRQELQARERGDWAESERLFAAHRTEMTYMAALTALLPGTDWLEVRA